MRRLGATILVLALALAMFPMTALAANSAKFYDWDSISGALTAIDIDDQTDDLTDGDTRSDVAGATNNVFMTGNATLDDDLTLTSKTLVINGGTLSVTSGTLTIGSLITLGNGTIVVSAGAKLIINSVEYFKTGDKIELASGTASFSTINSADGASIGDPIDTFITYTNPSVTTSNVITIAGDSKLNTSALALTAYDKFTIASGTMDANGQNITIAADATLTNNGTISGTGSDITNSGTLTINGTITTTGDVTNTIGTTTIGGSGELNCNDLVVTDGKLTNSGDINTSGTITNSTGATLENNGDIAATGNISNAGTLTNNSNGDIYALADLINAKTITNYGLIDVTGDLTGTGGTIYNPGIFLVDGTITDETLLIGSNAINYIPPTLPRNNNNYYYGANPTGPILTHISGGVFSSTGFFNQFQSFSANGVTLTRGTDYTVENVGGAARIIVDSSVMNGLSGTVKFAAVFTGATAATTITLGNTYVPSEVVLDPPKTGDASSILGASLVFMALALAAVTRKVRAGVK